MNAKEVSEALGQIDEQFVTEALTYKRKKTPLWFTLTAAAACLCMLVGLLVPIMGPMGASPTVGWNDGGTEVYHGDGVPVEGLVISGDTESVEVRDLRITLDLTHSPLDQELPHQNNVALEYTFRNPTEEPITLTLTLPCGQDPHYAGSIEYETGTPLFDANRHLYTVSADDTPVDFRLRLTGSDNPPQQEGEWSIDQFHNDTPVTVFTYEVQALDSGETAYASIWGPGMNGTVILLEDQWGGALINGNTVRTHQVSVGDTVDLYVFGDASGFNPAWRFYADFQRNHLTSGTMELVSTRQLSFLEYASQSWDADSGISQSDWACTLASLLNRSTYVDGMASLDYTSYLINRWLEYELTLEPGETVVNTVTMPAYPDVALIYSGTHQLTCELDLLSLRMAQPQNGPVLSLNTPYIMTESSAEFTDTENGYTLDMTEVYKISLDFTLKEPQPEPAPTEENTTKWNLAVPLAAVLCTGGLVILLIVSRTWKKRTNE